VTVSPRAAMARVVPREGVSCSELQEKGPWPLEFGSASGGGPWACEPLHAVSWTNTEGEIPGKRTIFPPIFLDFLGRIGRVYVGIVLHHARIYC